MRGTRLVPENAAAQIGARIDGLFRAVGELEKRQRQLTVDLGKVLQQLGESLDEVRASVGATLEVASAIREVVGPEKVAEALKVIRAKREVEVQAKRHEFLLNSVAEGKMKSAEKVSDAKRDGDGAVTELGSYVVGVEFDPEGKEMAPGKVVLQMAEMGEPYRSMLVGVARAASIPVPRKKSAAGPDGAPAEGRFEVHAVFDLVPVEVAPAQAEPPPVEPRGAA